MLCHDWVTIRSTVNVIISGGEDVFNDGYYI